MDRHQTPTQAPSAQRRRGSLFVRRLTLPVAVALLLAGCSTSPPGEGGPVTVAPNVTIAPFPTVAPFPTRDRPSPGDPPGAEPTTAAVASATPAASATTAPATQLPAPSATRATAGYPLTLADDQGTSVTIPAEPQRIVSLSPSNTEIVFALGAGDRLVGGTDADDYPAEAAALPDVVSKTKVLQEQIVDLEPDLILAQDFTPVAEVQRMRELGYPTLVLGPTTVDEVIADIQLLGRATGETEAGDAIAADMTSRIDAITTAAQATTDRPTTFYEIGYGPDIYAPVPGSVYGEEIEMAGGDPVLGDPTTYTISLEKLLKADPDLILLGDAMYGTCPKDIAKRPGWKTLSAVKDGDVIPVYDTVITRPGPRLPEGIASLARAIHTELTFPDEPADPSMCQPA